VRAILVVVLVACSAPRRIGSPCSDGPAFQPFDQRAAPVKVEPADGILDGFVAWYQGHGRGPGESCRFAPSCSAYARIALRRYGPLGLILVVDRLIVREHAFAASSYPITCVDRVTKLADAVP
jgi:putative component of membrane protein insertase Oxa1/YidC/SpoIIIJ protein YidD